MQTYVPLVRTWHPAETINRAIGLVADGLTHREAAEVSGVSMHTLRLRRYRGPPERAEHSTGCAACGARPHEFHALHAEVYAYLLGVYLGDGFLTHRRDGVYTLRVVLDSAYPGIIGEVVMSIEWLRGRRPHVARDRTGKNCVVVQSYWKQWACYLPQHGPGRKHTRRIALEPWQQALVDAAPGMFPRGLIHTDGWRGVNRVTAKGKAYAYPRYQFSNRSDDIRRLFCDACDRVGIDWRSWGRWHISVAKRESVARLDALVGPKS